MVVHPQQTGKKEMVKATAATGLAANQKKSLLKRQSSRKLRIAGADPERVEMSDDEEIAGSAVAQPAQTSSS